ncbi:MAG: hypothetical protein QOF78_720 [Phycisphaerales bacterium]|nr:hypothetical protein [Phycisphaerales bacterium]
MADSPQTSVPGPRPTSTRSWRDDVYAEWNRFRASLTRENLIAKAKTLAWVAPLTLLIWIYAEREQVAIYNDEPVPFELVSGNDGRFITLKQDTNLILKLTGPRAAVANVLNDLRGGRNPRGLQLEVPSTLELNRETSLPALPMVRSQRAFIDRGITVLSVQPANLTLQVDEKVERDANIVLPPARKNVDASFVPSTVKLRGPLSALQRAEQALGGQLAVHGDFSGDLLRQPGHYDLPKPGLPDVVLRKPTELQDERIEIVAPPEKIRASVDVRQADKTHLVRSMPITIDATDGLLEKYKVEWVRPTAPVLQNVTISGPPDVIDTIERPDLPKPKARLVVTPQDVGDRRSKIVLYDLPDKVKVGDEDRNRTVEFRLVPWTTPPSQ